MKILCKQKLKMSERHYAFRPTNPGVKWKNDVKMMYVYDGRYAAEHNDH